MRACSESYLDALIAASPLECIDPEANLYSNATFFKQNYRVRAIGIVLVAVRAIHKFLRVLTTLRIEGTSNLRDYNASEVVIFGPEQLIRMTDGCYFQAEVKERSQLIPIDQHYMVPFISQSLLRIYVKLIAIAYSKRSNSAGISRVERIILCVSYILSFDACRNIALVNELEMFIDALKPKIILCFHEMHPYARIVWSVANQKNVQTFAVQHAHIHKFRGLLRVTGLDGRLLPSRLLVWNNAALRTALQLGWPSSKLQLFSAERFQVHRIATSTNLIEFSNSCKQDVALLLPSLLRQEFDTCIIAGIALSNLYPALKTFIKPHPNFQLTGRDIKLCKQYGIQLIPRGGAITINSERINLTITCSSTAPMEYVHMGFTPIYIPILLHYDSSSILSILPDLTATLKQHIYRTLTQPTADSGEYFGLHSARLVDYIDQSV